MSVRKGKQRISKRPSLSELRRRVEGAAVYRRRERWRRELADLEAECWQKMGDKVLDILIA